MMPLYTHLLHVPIWLYGSICDLRYVWLTTYHLPLTTSMFSRIKPSEIINRRYHTLLIAIIIAYVLYKCFINYNTQYNINSIILCWAHRGGALSRGLVMGNIRSVLFPLSNTITSTLVFLHTRTHHRIFGRIFIVLNKYIIIIYIQFRGQKQTNYCERLYNYDQLRVEGIIFWYK